MSSFYIKGIDEDVSLLESKLEIIPVYNKYESFGFKNKNYILNRTAEYIDQNNDGKINVIAHSFGCNLAISLASYMENIDSLVLVSPEFSKRIIKPESSITGIKKLDLSLRSKLWLKKDIQIIRYKGIPTLFIYSKNEEENTKQFIKNMADYGCFSEYEDMEDTSTKLIYEDRCINKIKDFINR